MQILTAAVVLVGLLCVLDLILTLGVIRRLREHTELLSRQRHGGPGTPVGEEIGEFRASTVDGDPVTRDDLADATGDTFVAVLTPHCRPCTEKLPALVTHLRSRLGGRSRALTVVVGDAGEAADMLAALQPVARVVVEKPGGPLATAFRATAFPTLLTVTPDGAGRLRVTGNHLDVPVQSG